MADNRSKDCPTGACPVGRKDGKLVKSTDLPLLGNPYPPKDVIQNDTPGSLELSIASLRTTVQPYMAPVCKVYQKTSEVLSIGVAHSQGAIVNLRENQSSFTNALFIAGSGLMGLALARRRGIFKKLLFGSVFAGGAASICYPKEAKDRVDILWLITQNKLPSLVQQQYGNLVKVTSKPQETKVNKDGDSKTSSG